MNYLPDTVGGPGRAHPNCWVDELPDSPGYYRHTCHVPSGHRCYVTGCTAPAGTRWTAYWCPHHDAERINRISRQLHELRYPADVDADVDADADATKPE